MKKDFASKLISYIEKDIKPTEFDNFRDVRYPNVFSGEEVDNMCKNFIDCKYDSFDYIYEYGKEMVPIYTSDLYERAYDISPYVDELIYEGMFNVDMSTRRDRRVPTLDTMLQYGYSEAYYDVLNANKYNISKVYACEAMIDYIEENKSEINEIIEKEYDGDFDEFTIDHIDDTIEEITKLYEEDELNLCDKPDMDKYSLGKEVNRILEDKKYETLY